MHYIDVHCHLADPRVLDLSAMLARAEKVGVRSFIQGGVCPDDWERQLNLQKAFPSVIPTFGIHPVWAATASDEEIEAALQILKSKLSPAMALGEIGLDHGLKTSKDSHEKQLRVFQAQLEIAEEWELPLVLHVVQAHGLCLEILRSKERCFNGILHSFSGSLEVAREYLALGFSLSISGAVTKPGHRQLKGAIAGIPGDRLLVETDCPDQRPEPFQAELNEPAALLQVARAVSALRNEDAVITLERSASNARRIFRL